MPPFIARNSAGRYPSVPNEGDIVMVQGYEFAAHDITIETHADRRVLRFTGICTANSRNDSIRHTAYNGGRYGGILA